MNCRETDPLLSAFLDGELDLMRALEVEAHIGECANCAARLKSARQLADAVSQAPYYRAPSSLRMRVERPAASLWQRPAPWLALAASIVVAILVVGRADPTGDEVARAHLRSLRSGHLVDVAASGRRSVRPWFAEKLDYALDVEDISGRGFQLTGGRLDSLNGRTVAVLVYQRGTHVISVFVWPAAESSDRNPTGAVRDGLNVVTWRAEGMTWWAVSDLDRSELEALPLCPCFMPVHETLRG
jgi:anti-sigma factor RsiW